MSNDGGYWIKEVWPRVEAHKYRGSGGVTRRREADGLYSRRHAGGDRTFAAILFLVFLGLIALPRFVSATEGFSWNPAASTCLLLEP